MIARIFTGTKGPRDVVVPPTCSVRVRPLDPTVEWLLRTKQPLQVEYQRLLDYFLRP